MLKWYLCHLLAEKLDHTLAEYDSDRHSIGYSGELGAMAAGKGIDPDNKTASIRRQTKRLTSVPLDTIFTHEDEEFADVDRSASNQAKPVVSGVPRMYASPAELQAHVSSHHRSTPNLREQYPGMASQEEYSHHIARVELRDNKMGAAGAYPLHKPDEYAPGGHTVTNVRISTVETHDQVSYHKGPDETIYAVPYASKGLPRRYSQENQVESSADSGLSVNIGPSSGRPEPKGPAPPPPHDKKKALIPPPPTHPAPAPPSAEVGEMIPISTKTPHGYANVSGEIMRRKGGSASSQEGDAAVESSFRPGSGARLTKAPVVLPKAAVIVKNEHSRSSSMSSTVSSSLSDHSSGHHVLLRQTSIEDENKVVVAPAASDVYYQRRGNGTSQNEQYYEPEPDYEVGDSVDSRKNVSLNTKVPSPSQQKSYNDAFGNSIKAAALAREKRAREEEAKRQAAEEMRQKQEAEQARRRKFAEEEARQKKVAEEARLKREADDARRRQLAEEAKKMQEAEEAKRKQMEEEKRKRLVEEARERQAAAEEARRKNVEEEAKRKQEAEELRERQAAAAAAARERYAEEVAKQRQAEEELRQKKAQEEAERQRKIEEERARQRKAAEEAERQRKTAEEAERQRRAAEAERQQKAAEEAERQQKALEAKRKQEEELRSKREEQEAKRLIEEKARQERELEVRKEKERQVAARQQVSSPPPPPPPPTNVPPPPPVVAPPQPQDKAPSTPRQTPPHVQKELEEKKRREDSHAALMAAVAKRRNVVDQNKDETPESIEARVKGAKYTPSTVFKGNGARNTLTSPKEPTKKQAPPPPTMTKVVEKTTVTTTSATQEKKPAPGTPSLPPTANSKPSLENKPEGGTAEELDFLAMAERARMEWLQKKTSSPPSTLGRTAAPKPNKEGGEKEKDKSPPPEVLQDHPVPKTPTTPAQRPQSPDRSAPGLGNLASVIAQRAQQRQQNVDETKVNKMDTNKGGTVIYRSGPAGSKANSGAPGTQPKPGLNRNADNSAKTVEIKGATVDYSNTETPGASRNSSFHGKPNGQSADRLSTSSRSRVFGAASVSKPQQTVSSPQNNNSFSIDDVPPPMIPPPQDFAVGGGHAGYTAASPSGSQRGTMPGKPTQRQSTSGTATRGSSSVARTVVVHNNTATSSAVDGTFVPPPPVFDSGTQPVGLAPRVDDTSSLTSTLSTLSSAPDQDTVPHSTGYSIAPPPPSGESAVASKIEIAPPPPGFDDSPSDFIPPPMGFDSKTVTAGSPVNREGSTGSGPSHSMVFPAVKKPASHLPRAFQTKAVETWSSGDVGDWLDSVQLGEHRASFAKSSVSGQKLMQMGRQEMISLGMTQVTHRMNFERALKKAMNSKKWNWPAR